MLLPSSYQLLPDSGLVLLQDEVLQCSLHRHGVLRCCHAQASIKRSMYHAVRLLAFDMLRFCECPVCAKIL